MKSYRVFVILLLLPSRSFADNCGDYHDCFTAFQLAIATAVGLAVLILLLLYVPYLGLGVGITKGAIEAATGKDLITGSKLEKWERALGIVPTFVLVPKVGQVVRQGKTIIDLLRKSGNLGAKGEVKLTEHGAERIAGVTATRGGVLSMDGINATKSLGRAFTQADGAKVFLHEATPGRFNAVIQNQTTGKVITTMNNWSQKSIIRIAKNYGWPIH